ncbi:tRNA lysidine(34) synthetase TilS [uncultured Roseobacter sp.]|uniref:tRNA lysidine(34) synthetase TilS n=1 Tax=uncultured Roseobacter sp. TaxID=114847 RepID=UPI0026132F26|nr:tRNA lysidine(34) synthetase TilS [uncultured Roseobacter sp.]
MHAALISKLTNGLRAGPGGPLGVAVSGGSDSVALLHLLAGHAPVRDAGLSCVTVDHGLRPEAAEEAAFVSQLCSGLGIAHQTLQWRGWDGKGNTQDAARQARYGLIAGWAGQRGITAVALGHTQDDQAETVLMRLARGAGVDGLSAMAPRRDAHGISWLRPLLDAGRQELRNYLTGQGIAWKDDPGNENPDYERIRARTALQDFAPLGIDAKRLAMIAGHMADAREVLQQHMLSVADSLIAVDGGAVRLPWEAFSELPAETKRRLITGVMRWMNGGGYAPRHSAVAAFLSSLQDAGAGTAAGTQGLVRRDVLWMFREYAVVRDLRGAPGMVWDHRWTLTGPAPPSGACVGALGPEGLKTCENWRDTGMPRAALLATPAVRTGETLVAAPVAQTVSNWETGPECTKAALLSALLSH